VVDPLVRDQEMDLAFRYWEGAVRVSGEHEGRDVSGAGFVELTGYASLSSTRPIPAAGSPDGR
jgi:predicted secreted hydrolase